VSRTTGMAPMVSAWSDEAGNFTGDGILPGEYVAGVNIRRPASPLMPYPATYFPGVHDPDAALIIRITPGTDINLGDLQLPPPLEEASITGRALLPDGSPAREAFVRLLDGKVLVEYAGSESFVGDDGSFEVHGYLGEPYIVHVFAMNEGFRGESEPITAGQVAPVVIHLEPFTFE
jgi:hypothetical protein